MSKATDIPRTELSAPVESRERYPNRYKKGQSGNPSGRPKMTDEQREALSMIKSLAPMAAKKMKEILSNPKTSVYAKIQVITLILNRTYGLPESAIKVSGEQQTIETSIACIHALVQDLIPEE